MKRAVAVVAGISVFVVAATAWAAKVDIPGTYDTLNLEGNGNTRFDSAQPIDAYNDDCALGDLGGAEEDDLGYSPANDVAAGTYSDTFDGGDVLWLQKGNNRVPFEDGNAKGTKRGDDFLKTGPEKLQGLRVTRSEEAMHSAPALRSLISLKNRKGKAAKRTVVWDSDLGADGAEVARASSDGGNGLADGDSWFLFADTESGDGSDAVGTMVLYGKGGKAATKVRDGVANQDGCVSFKMEISVPPNSTRYLLFFTESHPGDAISDAKKDAKRYNDREPAKVLKGLSGSVRSKILNWDLG